MNTKELQQELLEIISNIVAESDDETVNAMQERALEVISDLRDHINDDIEYGQLKMTILDCIVKCDSQGDVRLNNESLLVLEQAVKKLGGKTSQRNAEEMRRNHEEMRRLLEKAERLVEEIKRNAEAPQRLQEELQQVVEESQRLAEESRQLLEETRRFMEEGRGESESPLNLESVGNVQKSVSNRIFSSTQFSIY